MKYSDNDQKSDLPESCLCFEAMKSGGPCAHFQDILKDINPYP